MENKLLCRCWKWSLQIKNRRGKEPLAEKGTPERLKLNPNKLKKTRENANLRKRKYKERSEKKWLQTMWNRLSGNDVCWEETKQQCNSTNHQDCVWKMVGMLKRKIIREKGWAAEKEEHNLMTSPIGGRSAKKRDKNTYHHPWSTSWQLLLNSIS